MTNEVTIKSEVQLAKIAEYFENTGVVDYFVRNFGYPAPLVIREATAFAYKTQMIDLKNKDNSKHHPLAVCSGISKQQAFMNLLAWGLPSDARDLYYLYNENGQMTCELSYKGLIYICEQNGIHIHGGLIFEGDKFNLKETDAGDTYIIERGDPFTRKKIIGCFVLTQIDEEKRVYTYSYNELEASRQASRKKMYGKDSPAWANHSNDMYLKCGIRKAGKIVIAKVPVKTDIRALFDDEMQEASAPAPVASQKTADFASQQEDETPVIDYDMATAEQIDEDFKQQQFAELQAQFDYRSENHDL